MFEKEAEERFQCKKVLYKWETDKRSYVDGFKDGAQFGYNKCKEELNHKGLALQSDMDKTIEQNIEYKEFLKHLSINPMLMVADMRSRLPDSEKPMFVSRCKEFEVCERVKNKGCSGCNVWNYLYDIKALQKRCKEHGKEIKKIWE